MTNEISDAFDGLTEERACSKRGRSYGEHRE